MRKLKIDSKYFTICVYVFLVVAISSLVLLAGINATKIFGFIDSFIDVIKCAVYGLCFAYFMNYFLGLFENRIFKKMKSSVLKRFISLVLAYIMLLGIIVGFCFLVIPQITDNSDILVSNVKNAYAQFKEKFSYIVDYFRNLNITSSLMENIESIITTVASYVGTILLEVGNIVLGLIISFYVLFNKEFLIVFFKKVLNFILPGQAYKKSIKFIKMTNDVFGKYLIGQIIDAFIVGVITLISLWIFRVPYYYLVAVIVAITNVIPYFGPFIGAIPSFIIILTTSPIKAILFVVIILIIQQIDGNIICPRILGNSTGLSSVWIILSITIFSAIFGLIGMFIGVPLFTVLYNLISQFINSRLKKKNYPINHPAYELFVASPIVAYNDLNLYVRKKRTENTASENEAEHITENTAKTDILHETSSIINNQADHTKEDEQ